MEAPYILHMLGPLKHVSPFDVNMALDAGFNTVVPYTSVELADVRGLTQDAIFSRGPKGAKRTGIFIGGKDAIVALDMLVAARKAMFPPFQISVFADPAGSFTTAAAMVAKVEKALKTQTGAGLSGRTVAVFGATGVVGFAAGVIAAAEGAKVNLIGYDGPARVKALAELAKQRFNVDVSYSDGSSDALKGEAIKSIDVILCAGRAGVQILSSQQVSQVRNLKVAADVNAVPPAGIEGLAAQGDGVALKAGVGIGALAIGAIKYKVQSGLFRKMIETDKPLFLDFRDAFALARELVG
jgi:methylene-tetrahydromethanopterin dehydrogenase